MTTTFDLALFLALNDEYQEKPLVPTPPRYDNKSLDQRGSKRADDIFAIMGSPGRVLEIGCGHGEVCRALAIRHGCEAVGVDVETRSQWKEDVPNVALICHDLTAGPIPDLGEFDLIYSNSVFEHVIHPFAMLKAAFDLLKPGGRLILNANLYRGPKASHRYGQVFFPWPHLLFTDEVFRDFYRSIGLSPAGAAWVNQLSVADYFRYFDLIGFDRVVTRFSKTPLDRPFYERFSDVLERFPICDLERDFLRVQLVKPKQPRTEGFIEHTILFKERAELIERNSALKKISNTLKEKNNTLKEKNDALKEKNKALSGQIVKLRSDLILTKSSHEEFKNSTSWRVTAPMRLLSNMLRNIKNP